MQTKEIYFTSNDGKSRIHAVEWVPENRPKAILQLVHGMAEHIERYGEFATFMAEHGYLVVPRKPCTVRSPYVLEWQVC